MNKSSTDILDHLIRDKDTREKRLIELLKDPDCNGKNEWHMCVPPSFNDALDIKQTERVKDGQKVLVWTQGSSFSFKSGDVLYDSSDAYKVWAQALKKINLCVYVETSSSAGPMESAGRYGGSITFSILIPDATRKRVLKRGEHTMSQDDFVRFLIEGPTNDLFEKLKRLES